MVRLGAALIVLAATLPAAPSAPAHSQRGGPGVQQEGPRMGHGGLRPSRAGVPIGPQHQTTGIPGGRRDGAHVHGHGHGHGHGHLHGGSFVHAGHGAGWWVVAGSWYPWYPAAEAVTPVVVEAAYYCPSAAAYFPAVQACPEGWVLVVPPAPMP